MSIPLRTGSIYSLSDPRDGAIRYIGQTTQPLPMRRDQHLYDPTNPAMGVWIGLLVGQGLEPIIKQVVRVPAADLVKVEKEQIELHHRGGHPLLNGEHRRRNLKPLIRNAQLLAGVQPGAHVAQDGSSPPGPGPHVEEKDDLSNPLGLGPEALGRFQWRAEWRIRLPAGHNRFGVFLLDAGWLLGQWLALILGFCVGGVRTFLGRSRVRKWAGLLALYAAFMPSDPGLRAFARDYVLPHLPVARMESMWHTYFEHYATTLLRGFEVVLAIGLGGSLLLFAMTYSEQIKLAREARSRRAREKKEKLKRAAAAPPGPRILAADLDGALVYGIPASPAVAAMLPQPPATS
ncbi:hypothetical protein ACWCYY_11285 [Kitasatospora sp. NPDC001664]